MSAQMTALCERTPTLHTVDENVANKRLLARVRALVAGQSAAPRKRLSAFQAIHDYVAHKRLLARVRAPMGDQMAAH